MDSTETILGARLGIRRIREIADWAMAEDDNFDRVYRLINAEDERTGLNALWCMTLLVKKCSKQLYAHQDDFIDKLLVETNGSRKRMYFKLLREQPFEKERLRADFLDFCLTKINSESEAYAVRAFSIYCAYKMCRHYPELMTELDCALDVLSTQPLSPGLRCALRNTRRNIR